MAETCHLVFQALKTVEQSISKGEAGSHSANFQEGRCMEHATTESCRCLRDGHHTRSICVSPISISASFLATLSFLLTDYITLFSAYTDTLNPGSSPKVKDNFTLEESSLLCFSSLDLGNTRSCSRL